MSSLKSLIVEPINSDYAYVKYADLVIIMNLKDEYLNMTKVVKLDINHDGNSKELKEWFRNNKSEELIKEIENEEGISSSFYIITTGEKFLHGTYCHKLLVPHILSWCSAKFAIKVSQIVNMYYVHMGDIKTAEMNRKHEEMMNQLKSDSSKREKEYESTITEIKTQAAENRKLIVDKYNDLVGRFNQRGQEIKSLTVKLDATNASHQARYDSILQAFDGVTIKNTKGANYAIKSQKRHQQSPNR